MGVVRKRGGTTVQLNSASDAERFKKINTGDIEVHEDDEIHQKIQLMTVKKTAEVASDNQKVIALKPKKEKEKKDEDYFGNVMMNRVRINKNK